MYGEKMVVVMWLELVLLFIDDMVVGEIDMVSSKVVDDVMLVIFILMLLCFFFCLGLF